MIDKALVRNEFGRHDRDTGSSEVQIATLTKEILALTEHLKQNKKDHSSRYGLIRKVNNRRKLLNYLKREDEAKYKDLIKKLSGSALEIYKGAAAVKQAADRALAVEDMTAQAKAFCSEVIPAMNALRASVDAAEPLVAADVWPVPTYGDSIVVEWLDFLREERRFDSVAALREQLVRDVAAARERETANFRE